MYYSHAPHSLRYDEIETCVTMLSITIGSLHNKSKIIRQIYAAILPEADNTVAKVSEKFLLDRVFTWERAQLVLRMSIHAMV